MCLGEVGGKRFGNNSTLSLMINIYTYLPNNVYQNGVDSQVWGLE